MEPQKHLGVRNAFAIGCWLVLMAVVVWRSFAPVGAGEQSTAGWMLTFVGGAVLAVVLTALATETIFRWLVPARCPYCGGRMRSRMDPTMKYCCARCGHEHDTGWQPPTGGDGGWPGAGSGSSGGGNGG